MVKSKEAREYRDNLPLPRFIDMIHDPIAVEIRWSRKKRMGDLDNRLKVILDALSGRFWPDDKLIVELHAYRTDGGDDTVTVTWWAA
jgi:Holliday junction resolvase RusA-like endonuclease